MTAVPLNPLPLLHIAVTDSAVKSKAESLPVRSTLFPFLNRSPDLSLYLLSCQGLLLYLPIPAPPNSKTTLAGSRTPKGLNSLIAVQRTLQVLEDATGLSAGCLPPEPRLNVPGARRQSVASHDLVREHDLVVVGATRMSTPARHLLAAGLRGRTTIAMCQQRSSHGSRRRPFGPPSELLRV